MRHPFRALLVATLAVALLVGVPTRRAEASAVRGSYSVQYVSLQAAAGDNSSSGVTELSVTKESNGYRLRGYVRSDAGCVKLMAVTMHWGDYVGGDEVVRTCEAGVEAPVDAWTHHPDVVLVAIVPNGPDWQSHIAGLTG
ncbi:hypothetical protein [Streptacidiphilus sp. EB129]|uniref:hypothetical protein n=1 Tax=Streptacidiphilus sp. EB129 TaxID=3156262 RepID=UPI003511F566